MHEYPIFERKQQTQQNAIRSEENEHFVCRTHQNATTNHIPLAFPFWFNRTIRPFKVVSLPREKAPLTTIPNNITIWSISST
jgi:hypothetical protein